MLKFSPSTLGFYDTNIHAVKSIPSDAIEVSADVRNSLAGKPVVSDANGHPVEAPPAVVHHEELMRRAKEELRAMRAPMLDALTGIAGRAVRSGNDALASEADALAVLLLDITDDQALNTATTYEEMQAAGVAAYKRIAATASAELAVVFKEITGG